MNFRELLKRQRSKKKKITYLTFKGIHIFILLNWQNTGKQGVLGNCLKLRFLYTKDGGNTFITENDCLLVDIVSSRSARQISEFIRYLPESSSLSSCRKYSQLLCSEDRSSPS